MSSNYRLGCIAASSKHSLKRSGLPSSKLDVRSKGAVIDLAAFFITWDRKCCLFAGFSPTHRWEILIKVDASTDFGTGGVCFPSLDCFVHEWSPDERSRALAHSALPIRESTTFFELLGIFLILAHFAPMLRGRRVQIECDNEAAIRDLGTCFSGKPLCMAVIADIRNLCASSFIIPRYEHILSQYNLIADRLSHNDFLQAKVLCQGISAGTATPPSSLRPGAARRPALLPVIASHILSHCDFQLACDISDLLRESIGAGTRGTYSCGFKSLATFCKTKKLCALPVDAVTLISWMTVTCQRITVKSVVKYMCGIRFAHIVEGFEWTLTGHPLVKMAITGLKKKYPTSNILQKIPLSLSMLLQMCQCMHGWPFIKELSFNDLACATASCIAFFACLRGGEFPSGF